MGGGGGGGGGGVGGYEIRPGYDPALMKKQFLKMSGESLYSKLDSGSSLVCIFKTASKKIGE